MGTATLNLGADKSNRTITVTGTAGTAVGSNTVSVTGSAITISGNSSLTFGASTTLIFSVKDSAGNAMPGVTVALTSSAGNTLSPSIGTTDAAGQLTTTVTATNVAVSDVITATAAGASKTQNLIINSSAFNITTPVLNKLIKINTSEPISLTWTNSGGPVAASSVNFSSSRGTLTGAAATTNGSGVATATISSNTTGSTIISAAGTNGTPSTSVSVTFYTDNTDFFNGSTLEQDPLYAVQGHLIRSLSHGIWISLNGTHFRGERTTLNGVEGDNMQSNTRAGLTLAIPVDRHHSLKLYASTGTSTRTGSDFDAVGIAWQYRWGEGY